MRHPKKKRQCQSDKQTKRKERRREERKIVSKIEIKLQFPCVMPTQYDEHPTAAENHLQYHCA